MTYNLDLSCKHMHLSFKSVSNKKHKGVICNMTSKVLTRILKIGVKMLPEKIGVLPYFSIGSFEKVGRQNQKVCVK